MAMDKHTSISIKGLDLVAQPVLSCDFQDDRDWSAGWADLDGNTNVVRATTGTTAGNGR
jgi:hypothetical protein